MSRWLIAITTLSFACSFENRSHDCGNGIACPEELACDLVHRTCVPEESLEACAGHEELSACTTRMIDAGTCHEGLCVAAACGNGIWDKDHDEECDDGNDQAGDGCSSTCRNEGCGNGVQDYGEQCDDGNLHSHDGCDSRCMQERLTWTPVVQLPSPALADMAWAYDEARRRLIMFGGIGADTRLRDDTLEWDGVGWHARDSAVKPAPRHGAAMVYDAAHRVVVLFGGQVGSGDRVGDTWVWDGERWIDRTREGGPSPRQGHVMAYDSARRRVVLFGGETMPDLFSDETWEWDGDAWRRAEPSVRPAARGWASAAYDPRSGHVVMAAGRSGAAYFYHEDTWLWDGAQWTAGPPGAGRSELAAMSFDPVQGMVLVGGVELTYSNGWKPAGLRVLRAAGWVSIADGGQAQRHGHAAFFDRRLGRTVIAGGRIGSSAEVELELWPPTDEMWTLDLGDQQASWQSLVAAAAPVSRVWSSVAYDSYRGRVVMFGGFSWPDGFNNSDTWELDDSTWQRRTITGASPSAANGGAGMAYDANRRRCVLFGGSPTYSDSTAWEWDGTQWTPNTASGDVPTRRLGPALAYDPATETTLLFGGLNGDALSDSWTWNGRSWTRLATQTTPPGRVFHAMTFDAANREIVMFGGRSISDTWTWTAADGWRLMAPTAAPSPRSGFGMTFDPTRQEVLVAGGDGAFDLWRWKGHEWSRVTTQGQPTQRQGISLVYDTARSQAILFGTFDATPGTYALRWASETPTDACEMAVDLDGDGLAGCADPDCSAFCSRCGDGMCDPLESCRLCPQDCGCTARCGDGFCDAPDETIANCPGDCTQ